MRRRNIGLEPRLKDSVAKVGGVLSFACPQMRHLLGDNAAAQLHAELQTWSILTYWHMLGVCSPTSVAPIE